MKVIIAGSRHITSLDLTPIIAASGFQITEVVSGRERKGVDRLGEEWAEARGIHVKPFPPDWDDLSHPGAAIRTRADGTKYDANAGKRRNQQMAEYADALIAIPCPESRGTWDMVNRARRQGLKVYVHEVKR
jgi:hypothetical protein